RLSGRFDSRRSAPLPERTRSRAGSPGTRRRLFTTPSIALGSILVVLIAALFGPAGASPASLAQSVSSASASNEVRITDSGFDPSSVTIGAGGSVHWTNASSAAQSVTSDDGLFDSGSIPPGGGFSIAAAASGTHAY